MVLFLGLLMGFNVFAQENPDGKALASLKKEISTLIKVADQSGDTSLNSFNSFSNVRDRRTKRLSQLAKSEMQAGDLEKEILVKLRTALETSQFASLDRLLASDISSPDFTSIAKSEERLIDGIAIRKSRDLPATTGKKSFHKNFAGLMEQFGKVEFVSLDLLHLKKAKDQSTAVVQLDIRGIDKAGQRRNDKAELALSLRGMGTSSMKLQALSIPEFTSLTLKRQPAFARVSGNAGFDQAKAYNRLEALRRGGYAFAVEDFNNDGKLDAFVGSYGESTLWLGEDGFKFKRVNHKAIDAITLAKAAAFADLDGDGWKDLVISRFSADHLKGDLMVFKNKNGTFEEVKDVFASGILRDYAMPMALADFNNDGLLDVYVGFPGSLDFSSVKADRKSGTSVHGLFVNKGAFKFEDQTQKMEAFDTANVMPHGALASDFNMDGKIDIMIMDDQANVGPIYKNDGYGRFSFNQDESQIVNIGFGMGITGGDFNNDGIFDYAVSNANFHSINRVNAADNPKMFSNKGLRVFMGQKTGKFTELAEASLADTGEGEGGVTVIDYDNDGNQDLYVVNGLWSGSGRDEKIDSIFAVAKKTGIIHQDHMQDGMGDRYPRGGARSIFMKALMEARVKKGGKSETMSLAGYQRNRLLKNLGNGEFIDVGYLENVDSMADGYMSLVADVNRDGSPDLLLRNCDPGSNAHTFPVVEAFQNNHQNRKMLSIGLKGKASNSMGVGAKVLAKIGGQNYVREIIANNSAVQGEVSALFGMAGHEKAETVTIQWPSGTVDTYQNLKAGRYVFEEGSQVKVSQN